MVATATWVARLAAQAGLSVSLLALGDASSASADAQEARARWAPHAPSQAATDSASVLAECDVLVDALFGIGLSRPPRDEAANVLRQLDDLAACRRPGVLALDVPSGLDADTGRVPGVALRADATVTFVAAKRGLFTGRAREFIGDAWLAPLGSAGEWSADAELDDARVQLARLPRRRAASHKGSHGHVLLLGGDEGYGGAIRMAAEAAARGGAGLVSVATRPANVTALQVARPEVMTRGVQEPGDLVAMLARATVVAIGPGLGTGAWGRDLLRAALASGLPAVLDADALNLLADGEVEADALTTPSRVLTPHPGEAARLLGSTVAEVEADRFTAVRALQARFGGTVVLKGAGTLVAAPPAMSSPAVSICMDGNPGMATGGMGDVLTGVIAALLAQFGAHARTGARAESDDSGALATTAARLGVAVHAAAGDRAAREGGQRGLLAMDVVGHLRAVLNGPDS